MNFTYFENPEVYTGLRDNVTTCHFCEDEKACFDAEAFYGEDTITSICPECLASGRLKEIDSNTCNGDIEELKRQLKELNPALSSADIDQIALQKTSLLEKTTPPLITWQDWDWPVIDGDYGKFVAYGSKPLYHHLAKETSSELLFKNSIVDDEADIDTDYLWNEVLPDSEIKDYNDSSDQATLFYVFKSLTSDKVVTIVDTE